MDIGFSVPDDALAFELGEGGGSEVFAEFDRWDGDRDGEWRAEEHDDGDADC